MGYESASANTDRVEESPIDILRSWLVLFRAHTVILEVPLAVLGAVLATGTLWSMQVLPWVGFGVLYHLVGYGMNSYSDWRNGYDKDDEFKSDHPLNTGEISPRAAKYAVYGSLALMIVYAMWLSDWSLLGLGLVTTMLVSGLIYNELGKQMVFKFVPITIAHTLVFVFPYAILDGQITPVFIAATSTVAVHQMYQIIISGDVKDILQDESSILGEIGVNAIDLEESTVFVLSHTAIGVAIWLVLAELLGGAVTGVLLLDEPASMTVLHAVSICTFGLLSAFASVWIIAPGNFNRERRVLAMSLKELFGIYMIIAAFMPLLELGGFILLVGGMAVYLVTLSEFMWDSSITPQV